MLLMTPEDTKTVKLTAYVPESIRRALASHAGLEGLTMGELLTLLTQQQLPEKVAEAERSIAAGKTAPKGKPGRKPRP